MQKKSHEKNTNVFLMLRPFMLTLQNIKIEKNVVKKIVDKKIVDKKIIESILLPKSRAPPTEQIPEQMVEPIINKVKPIAVVKSVEEKGKLFSPRQKDSLFWCYFIMKNGYSDYEYPGTTTFAREKELKFQYIEMLRSNKQLLKTKKIKNLREDIEDELANKEKIGMKTFIALCVASNLNILFIHKKKCFQSISEEDEPVYIVHQKEMNNYSKYFLQTDALKEEIQMYKNNYYQWENVDKPLKAPSAYKLEELKSLCEKICTKEEQTKGGLIKKTKKELYDLLVTTI
uniref:Uncharacterized protein n=1 Tax=viral metagenome TaxID=1070528 RepID=A0A6C0BAP5_9ZZZZ